MPDEGSVQALLAQTPWGKALSAEDLPRIAAIAAIQRLEPQALLFPEHGHSDQLYLVVRGLIALDMTLPRIGKTRVLTVGPGEFVGWSAIVGSGTMTTSATVIEPSILIAIPGSELQSLCESDHDVGYAVMQQLAVGLSRRLHATRLQLLDLFAETQPVPGLKFQPRSAP